MTSVWLVWRYRAGWPFLAAVCVNENDARAAADAEQRWLDGYHGPVYPCRWDQRLGEREFSNQYGDRVAWEEQRLWGIAA